MIPDKLPDDSVERKKAIEALRKEFEKKGLLDTPIDLGKILDDPAVQAEWRKEYPNMDAFLDHFIDIGINSGKTSGNLDEDFKMSKMDRLPLLELLKGKFEGNTIGLDRKFRKYMIISYIQAINYMRGNWKP